MSSASGYRVVCCPECPSTLMVSSTYPYRLTHHPDGSHTAQLAPADAELLSSRHDPAKIDE